jgi:peptidoglycan/LPS O-acetylase OafA/YrhL
MVVAVIPISLFALQMGCKKHKKFSVAILGIIGLTMLLLAVLFGESHLGEIGEKTLTSLGAIMIAISHVKNFRLCRTLENCPCPADK